MIRIGAFTALVLLAGAGCTRQAPQPVAPQPRDLVVLVPDPDTSEVGRLSVSTPAGQVELSGAGESTTVARGEAPGPMAILDDQTIQGMFGSTLAMLPPAAESFDLYFETGRDTLTPESAALLPQVIARARARAVPEVSVIGHTDTTGTAESNVVLGLSRATRIRDLLIEAGLEADLIEVTSHGESTPLVATPDNTPEARNRRVEVSIR